MAIHPAREVLTIASSTRPLGRTPSIFIEDYWVNEPEKGFEIWLYRRGFRPVWDNFLGATRTLNGIDVDTFNAYYHDKEHGFQVSQDFQQRGGWTWGHVAAFASVIKSIKLLVRKHG
jgi:hypothetical protein